MEFSAIEKLFISKISNAMNIIDSYNLSYTEYGLFGSVARGDYNASSDLDIVMIFKNLPERAIISKLRLELEEIDCDLAILLVDNFNKPKNAFHKDVRKDYRRIKRYGE